MGGRVNVGMWDQEDARYLRLDGLNTMVGPIVLPRAPTEDAHAARKDYVDGLIARSVGGFLRLDGTLPMTGPLTLPGAPTAALHAATRGYVDAADVLRLQLAGGVMTGLLELSGAPVLNLHAATKLYVDSLPPATLDTYDAIVAAAGGNYTSVVAACAGEAAGARIYIKPGTYNETADIVIKDGQMLVGANPENTIIDWGGGNFMATTGGATTNVQVKDLTFQAGIDTYMLYIQGNYSRVENCRFIGAGGANDHAVRVDGIYCTVRDCDVDNFTGAGQGVISMAGSCLCIGNHISNVHSGIDTGTASLITGNQIATCSNRQLQVRSGAMVIGNVLMGMAEIFLNGSNCIFQGNRINCGHGDIEYQGALTENLFVGNYFTDSGIKAVNAGATFATIIGNYFDSGQGVEWNGHGAVISVNIFKGADNVKLTAGSYENNVNGNNFSECLAASKIADTGTRNQAYNNLGASVLEEKKFDQMKNTSGGALVAGNVVVYKAVAAGDEFDTTVAAGDDMIYAMLDEGINNNAYGSVQTLGKTTKLKVNGTVAIGVGDHISTMNVAGIGRQAAAGHMAFAIALEAYAVADSNGVIDALLITPRKI